VVSSLSCDEAITIQHDQVSHEDRRTGILADQLQNSIVVYFENTFRDSITAYLNGAVIFDAFVDTEESKDGADTLFAFRYSDKNTIDILKIVSKQNGCIDFKIDRDYKLIYLFFTEERRWIARFSNIYYLR
jgi:hypothetical protein